MRRLDRLAGRGEARMGMSEWANLFQTWSVGGNSYTQPTTTYGKRGDEGVPNNFEGYVRAAYQANGPVFALILVRMLVLAEAPFAFKRKSTGEYWTSEALAPLEEPWPNGSTQELICRMEQDASLAGNFYATNRTSDGRIQRLRPDWVTIVRGTDDKPETADDLSEIDTYLLGYAYTPGGPAGRKRPTILLPNEVAHYSPLPDPLACWRGMSWLTPSLREIDADSAATDHKLQFFNNAATPNMTVTIDKSVKPEWVKEFRKEFNDEYAGVANAYQTMILGGGADVQVVGQSFEQMSFKATQGAGETRLAADAGVPPVIAGFSEGLASATYSNYGQARRRFADGTLHPLWRGKAHALSNLVRVPSDSRLAADTRDIPFLRDDAKDAAEVQRTHAVSIDLLVRAGFEPNTVVPAVMASDFKLLKHSGGIPTTLYPQGQDPNSAPTSNGSSPKEPATT